MLFGGLSSLCLMVVVGWWGSWFLCQPWHRFWVRKELDKQSHLCEGNESEAVTLRRRDSITLTAHEMERLFEVWTLTRESHPSLFLDNPPPPPPSGLFRLIPDCFARVLALLPQSSLVALAVTCRPVYHQVLGRLYGRIYVRSSDSPQGRSLSLCGSSTTPTAGHGWLLNPRPEIERQGFAFLYLGMTYSWTIVSPQGFERLTSNYELHSQKVRQIWVAYPRYSARFLRVMYRTFPHSLISLPWVAEAATSYLYDQTFVNFRRQTLWKRVTTLSVDDSVMLAFAPTGELTPTDALGLPDLPPALSRFEFHRHKGYSVVLVFRAWRLGLNRVTSLVMVGNPPDTLGQMATAGLEFTRLTQLGLHFTDKPHQLSFDALCDGFVILEECLGKLENLDFVYDSSYQQGAEPLLRDPPSHFIGIETAEYLESIDRFLALVARRCVALRGVSIFSHDAREQRQYKYVLPKYSQFLQLLGRSQLFRLHLNVGCEFGLNQFWTGIMHHALSLRVLAWNGNLSRSFLLPSGVCGVPGELDQVVMDMTTGDALTSRFLKPKPVQDVQTRLFLLEMQALGRARGRWHRTLNDVTTRATVALEWPHRELLAVNILGEAWGRVLGLALMFPRLRYVCTNGIHFIVDTEFDTVRRLVSVYDPPVPTTVVDIFGRLETRNGVVRVRVGEGPASCEPAWVGAFTLLRDVGILAEA